MKYPFDKHFLVCMGKSCRGEEIQEALKDYNKQRGRKPTVRVCRVTCLDLCDHGPNMIVDGVVYSHLTRELAQRVYDGVMGDGPMRPDLELTREEFEAGCSAAAPRNRK
ncbi:MAG TPA: (2Fe-2S) ferredoxin domain-containing protein [Thermoanaerobaculia bacterium]